MRLHAELEGRTDHPSRSVCFVVTHTKVREMFVADFRDRVAPYGSETLEGVWEPIFLHDSNAYRKGKGMHRQAMAAEALMNNVG